MFVFSVMLNGKIAKASELPFLAMTQEPSIFSQETIEEKLAKEEQLRNDMLLEEEVRKSDYGIILEKEKIGGTIGYNCVAYVKNKVKNMPQGLYNLDDKISIINSNEPREGSVAITDEGGVGHLSLVKEVKENTLVIEEGNFIAGYKTVRAIDKSLPIGYWVN